MSDEENTIPDGASPVRFMLAEAAGVEYRHCRGLDEARQINDAVVIMEGDYGGQIYFTCPVQWIRCDSDTLTRLFWDIDGLEWGDPDGAGLYFEMLKPGCRVPGGMGGGKVIDGVWLHPELEKHRADIEAVVSGDRARMRVTGTEQAAADQRPDGGDSEDE